MTSVGIPTVVSLLDRRTQGPPAEASILGLDRALPKVVISAVVFDMAGVLYEGTICQRWLWQLLLRLGVQVEYAQFCDTWEHDYLDAVNRGARSYEDAQHSFLLGFGLTPAQVEEVQAASHMRRSEVDLGVRPLPGVAATLAKLAAGGFKLAVLTNSWCSSPALRQMLNQLGLGTFISAVLSSCDLQATTPAAECYEAGLKLLGTPASQTLYVGNEARSLAGARAVGMHTAAFNFAAGAAADHYLHRFDDLVELAQLPLAASGTGYDRSAA